MKTSVLKYTAGASRVWHSTTSNLRAVLLRSVRHSVKVVWWWFFVIYFLECP